MNVVPNFAVLYVEDVRTSPETQDSTACYGSNFTFLHIHNVRTSQETPTDLHVLLRR
jgi:hypothetical protein